MSIVEPGQTTATTQYRGRPAEAIQSATSAAADLLGRAADVGSLSAGHFADLVATYADPLQRIEMLEHIDTVVKGGHGVCGTPTEIAVK